MRRASRGNGLPIDTYGSCIEATSRLQAMVAEQRDRERPADTGAWCTTHRQDQQIRALADRHYSRQSPGSPQFAPPGEGLFLISRCGCAAWVVVRNFFAGQRRWRCTLFRNEGRALSSDLIREATERTRAWWPSHYDVLPTEPLTTEVDPRRVRSKRDPGWCFLRAGWRRVGVKRGLVVLEAP